MNFKACTFGRLALIFFFFFGGGGRGAQVGENFTFGSEFITAQTSTLGVFIFLLGTLQATGSHQTPRSSEEDEAFF